MRLHARTRHVSSARYDFELLVLKFQEEHDLTLVEMSQILTGCLHEQLKIMLRHERHPDDPTQKADEE